MDVSQAISLALIQGITEFLPVSSSAHLILFPALMAWPNQGIVFDVAVHLGTLCAVIFHYRASLAEILRQPQRGNMALPLVVASIPVLVAGYTLENTIDQQLRAPLVIAWATIGFGLLLWVAVWRHSRLETESPAPLTNEINLKSALVIGFAQALALIPGTSRAGITITAGLLLGLSREQSINFSFLLAIPVILLATLYEAVKVGTDAISDPWINMLPMIALGFAVSAVFALLTIRLFLVLVERIGFMPFIIYRLALGLVLLVLFL